MQVTYDTYELFDITFTHILYIIKDQILNRKILDTHYYKKVILHRF